MAWQLLDEVNKPVDLLIEKELKSVFIKVLLDDWSNTSIDPVTAVSILFGECIYLLDE